MNISARREEGSEYLHPSGAQYSNEFDSALAVAITIQWHTASPSAATRPVPVIPRLKSASSNRHAVAVPASLVSRPDELPPRSATPGSDIGLRLMTAVVPPEPSLVDVQMIVRIPGLAM
jgi:hypothetical protein